MARTTTAARRPWPPWRVYAWLVQFRLASNDRVGAELDLMHLMTILGFSDLDTRPPGGA